MDGGINEQTGGNSLMKLVFSWNVRATRRNRLGVMVD